MTSWNGGPQYGQSSQSSQGNGGGGYQGGQGYFGGQGGGWGGNQPRQMMQQSQMQQRPMQPQNPQQGWLQQTRPPQQQYQMQQRSYAQPQMQMQQHPYQQQPSPPPQAAPPSGMPTMTKDPTTGQAIWSLPQPQQAPQQAPQQQQQMPQQQYGSHDPYGRTPQSMSMNQAGGPPSIQGYGQQQPSPPQYQMNYGGNQERSNAMYRPADSGMERFGF